MDPRELHIPVKVENGKLLLRSGAPLPDFHENAEGELRIAASDLIDPQQIPLFLEECSKPFLSAHSSLVAEVKREGVPEPLRKHLVGIKQAGRYLTGVPFTITADLEIILIAGKNGRLKDCPCHIPSLDRVAASINEAYTRISEAYEPARRSHTGNVFSKVFSTHSGCQSLNRLRADLEKNWNSSNQNTSP